MYKMTTKERMNRMYQHKEADRIPIWDSPWNGTIKRWHREGMPAGVDYTDYFDLDKVVGIGVDNTPQYEWKTLEQTDRYKIYTTHWGVTQKEFLEDDSTPEFIDFTITTPEKWEEAKKLMGTDPGQDSLGLSQGELQ